MSLIVGFTQRAETEWDAAFQWWAKHRSSEQAALWYNSIADASADLANNPQQ